jgi:hypothetical protein
MSPNDTGRRGLTEMSRVIFSSIFELHFTAKVFKLKAICFLKNENYIVTQGARGGSKPVSPNDTRGRGEGLK